MFSTVNELSIWQFEKHHTKSEAHKGLSLTTTTTKLYHMSILYAGIFKAIFNSNKKKERQ